MTISALLVLVLGLYLGGILALSVYASRRVHNEEDYLVAGRRLPLSLAWGTLLATWFGAATVLEAAAIARDEGVRGTVLDPFASGMALIVAGLFFAKPLWEMRLLTMGDFYRRVFGPRAELLACLILVPGYFGWIAAQYLALAGIQETFFDIDPQWGILTAALLVLVYTMIGGMWSVTITDTLQMVVVLITLIILASTTFELLGHGSVWGGIDRLIQETDPEYLTLLPEAGVIAGIAWLGTWGSGVFGNIPGQDLMQRVFSARDSRVAVRACWLAGTIYLAFGLLPVGLGLASRLIVPDDEGKQILSLLASQYLTPGLTVVFVVSLVSIIISTCTSAVLSPAAVLGHNLLGKLSFFRERRLFVSRLSVFLVTLASVVFAYSGKTIFELLELALSTVLVSLFVPLLMGLYAKRHSEQAALGAMIAGAVVWLLRELLEGMWWPMPENVLEESIAYADFLRQTIAPRFGTIVATCAFGFAALPSAVSGTIASFAGWYGGLWWSDRRTA